VCSTRSPNIPSSGLRGLEGALAGITHDLDQLASTSSLSLNRPKWRARAVHGAICRRARLDDVHPFPRLVARSANLVDLVAVLATSRTASLSRPWHMPSCIAKLGTPYSHALGRSQKRPIRMDFVIY
jgi:hypothetical protein